MRASICRYLVWIIFLDAIAIIAVGGANSGNSRLLRSIGVVRRRQRPGLHYFYNHFIRRRVSNRFWLHVSKTRPVVLFYNMCLLKNQKMTSLLVGTDYPRDAQT